MLEEIYNHLGYRLSLNAVAVQTLNAKKSGDGLQALAWYKQGELGKIRDYCEDDVRITRDLLYFGLQNEYFLFTNKAGKQVRLPLHLSRSIAGVLEGSLKD